MQKNIIRQIVDIQAQAERLIRTKANMVEIEQFSKYNDEIKSYLVNNIDDDFVLNHVKTIPNLNIDEIDVKNGLFGLIFIVLSGFSGWPVLYYEKRKAQKSLEIVRDIWGKYASSEFMLRNYFAS